MKKNITLVILLVFVQMFVVGCANTSELTEAEILAFSSILGENLTQNILTDLSVEVLTEDAKEKFTAVKKVYSYEDKYLFVSTPIGYNGPMTMAVVIDHTLKETVGIEIVEHVETEHYVRDFHNDWFTDRFAQKTIDVYLNYVHLEAKNDNEIVIITGATTTTEGAVLGVNACIGLYNEHFLDKNMPSVKLEAKIIN